MKKLFAVMFVVISLLISGCGNSLINEKAKSDTGKTPFESQNPTDYTTQPTSEPTSDASQKVSPLPSPTPPPIPGQGDYKPNEAGRVMVVMFHNFVESFTPSEYDNGEFTITFTDFEKLLSILYEKDYRLISLQNFLDNEILVPRGCIPMVFTFDDGSKGQFNLIKEDDSLKVNPKSAVGIMEEFHRKHPDFGLEGTFYVSLAANTFIGEGTIEERLDYLIERGFEIGNHTLTHIDLSQADKSKILKEVGGNQKKMDEIISGYLFKSLALPLGHNAEGELAGYVVQGEYEGTEYANRAIMRVGWDPTYSPINKSFNPLSTHRVRSPGINPIDFDLNWWLENLARSEQFISDGNPDTVTIPSLVEKDVDLTRLNGKKLILY